MISSNLFVTNKAKQNLIEIIDYIIREFSDPLVAKKIFEEITAKFETIKLFPMMGTIVENELVDDEEIRKTVVRKYNIYYKYIKKDNIVVILSIYHSLISKGGITTIS